MQTTISTLQKASAESFQAKPNHKIECCICLEEYSYQDSLMPDCKHSWCSECNEKLNQNRISSCPICKRKFKSLLKKGRWIFKMNGLQGKWIWEKGSEDSPRKLRYKKYQSILINIPYFFCVSSGRPVGGINI